MLELIVARENKHYMTSSGAEKVGIGNVCMRGSGKGCLGEVGFKQIENKGGLEIK